MGLAVELVCQLPAGVLVDRVNRRRLLIWCDLVRLAVFLGLGLALLTGHARVWLVALTVVVTAVCDTPAFTATIAAVRNLVHPAQVQQAMARNEARQHAVGLVGPPLGGLAFAVGRSVPFLANAFSYLFSLAALLLIRTPMQQERAVGAGKASAWQDMVEGLRYVATTAYVRACVAIGVPINLALNGALFGMVLVLRRHGVGPAAIGAAEGVFAVGGLLGAFAAGWMLQRVSVAWLIRAFTLAGPGLLLLAWPLAHGPQMAAPLALLAFASPALNAGLFGHLAKFVPDEMQGRVMSALALSVMSLASLAPVLAGLLVEHFGAAGLTIGAAAILAPAAVIAVGNRSIREIGA
jgi:MFS family permease